MTLFLVRSFFSFKVTRVFGPFIKLITISMAGLLVWSLFCLLIILIMANFLSTLLQENTGCHGLHSCGSLLIETMVGRVIFTSMDVNWSANLALASFSVILVAVLVNMVIAKINNIYSEVVRKGTLFYYKELFDLRYLYSLDNKYGYLVAL